MASSVHAASMCSVLALLSPVQRVASIDRAATLRSPPPPRMRIFRGLFDPINAESKLLTLAEAGGSRKEIVEAFETLERASPAPENLLTTDRGTRLLDGRWSLLSTVAARVGDEDIEDTGVSNAVNASGFVIDASKARKPVQEIDIARGRISNELRVEFGLINRSGVVRIAGCFEPDATFGRRANVDFDSLEFFLDRNDKRGGVVRLFRIGWLFTLVRAISPSLTDGADDRPWLETTSISRKARLGRGNKGSIFVLSRSDDGDGPLVGFSDW